MQEINEKEKLIREEFLSKKWPANVTLLSILLISLVVWQIYNIKIAILIFIVSFLLFLIFIPIPGFIVNHLVRKKLKRLK